MTVPVCKLHNTPMRESTKGGGYFCASKLPDGTWCKEKAKPPEGAAPQGATPAPAVGVSERYIAALEFAANVYRGVGPEMSDDALAFAQRVYHSFPS